MTEYTKREVLKYAGAGLGTAGLGSIAGCSGGSGDSTPTQTSEGGDGGATTTQQGPLNDKPLTYILPEGQLDIPVFLASTQQGIWSDHRIDLAPKVASFGKYARALTTGESMVGTANASIFNSARAQGKDIRLFGANLKQINSVFVRPDSDIESPADLEGKKVGVPFWSSGTTKTIASMIYDEYGIHLQKDTEGKSAPPAVLWEQLVNKQELDAIVEFTGYTIKGLANPDKAREIMSARQFWKDKTGHPSLVSLFAARGDWMDSNPQIARNFLKGWSDSVGYTKENLEQVYDQYGLLAGIETDAEFQTVLDKFEKGHVTVDSPSEWSKDLIDAQFKLYQVMHDAGFTEGVPDRDESVVSYSELQDL